MSLRKSRPLFFENSKVPVVLSKFAPINIGAITLGPLVFSRDEMSDRTKTHETIHWQQYIETGIIGFLILYLFYYLVGLVKYRSGDKAYYSIPFEQEAYEFDEDPEYPVTRKRFKWLEFKV